MRTQPTVISSVQRLYGVPPRYDFNFTRIRIQINCCKLGIFVVWKLCCKVKIVREFLYLKAPARFQVEQWNLKHQQNCFDEIDLKTKIKIETKLTLLKSIVVVR